eukprot:3195248-Pyramimonas_sp.AAC.1
MMRRAAGSALGERRGGGAGTTLRREGKGTLEGLAESTCHAATPERVRGHGGGRTVGRSGSTCRVFVCVGRARSALAIAGPVVAPAAGL